MDYTGAGKLIIDAELRNITGSFGGYPSIVYGRSPWNKAIASDQPAKFPAQIKKMQKLTGLTEYYLTLNEIGGNIAYDLWLTDAQFPDNTNGGVEVMIWFWKNNTGPLGSYFAESTKGIKINNVPVNGKFKVYLEQKNAGRNWDVVSFVLDDTQTVQSGRVEVDLLDIIKTALALIARNEDIYLQDIEFGIEFTNQNQDFTLELVKYYLDQKCYP